MIMQVNAIKEITKIIIQFENLIKKLKKIKFSGKIKLSLQIIQFLHGFRNLY